MIKNKNYILDGFKLISTLSAMFCIIGFFAFLMTYANKYGFFPYSLFSFNGIWLWGIAGFYAESIFFLIASPIIGIIYLFRFKPNWKSATLLWILCLLVLLLFALNIFKNFQIKNLDLYLLMFYIIGLLLNITTAYVIMDFYKNNKSNILYPTAGFVIFACFIFIILFPDPFARAFEKFLKTKGLVAENVEIYLKDKQKFAYGTLRFKDSKNAYVEFWDHRQDCQKDIEIECEKYLFKQAVLAENVAILKDPKTIKESKKPQDSKDTQASQESGNSQNPKESTK
ncbi:hypothetical protein [Helicobacter sp. 11S02596-1]|uniref:hypothetical protein n=1 Tax=Helicobacter sp. 11S02596-1 TaxID=1476194 RepID=UPI000BA60908|nr:hypothetical protein [Helicobacter sp. 11S02596-1]PAF43537.1 hypothetical protein BJI48_04580 [Helicobacter sp. 11S02596-1]